MKMDKCITKEVVVRLTKSRALEKRDSDGTRVTDEEAEVARVTSESEGKVVETKGKKRETKEEECLTSGRSTPGVSPGQEDSAPAVGMEELQPEEGQERDSARFLRPRTPREPSTRFRRLSDEGESDSSVISAASRASAASASATSREPSRSRKRTKQSPPKGVPTRRRRSAATSGDDDGMVVDILDPSLAPTKTRAKANLLRDMDLQREMQGRPLDDLGACISDSLLTVEKIADRSKSLKGEYVHHLRMAARRTQAAADELAKRTSTETYVQRLEK